MPWVGGALRCAGAFNLVFSHYFYFCFCGFCFWCQIQKNFVTKADSKELTACVLLGFMVSGLRFGVFIRFELIFVFGVRQVV